MDIPFKSYWDLLWTHVRPQMSRFILLVVLLFTSIGLQIFNPQIMRYFIDTALGNQDGPLMLAAIAFISIAIIQQVVAVWATYTGENVAWTATNELRAELAAHCLRLDMSFHNDTSPGELIERIDGDVMELSTFFSSIVIRIFGNLLLLMGVLVVLFFEDWRLGLVFVIFSIITLYVLNLVRGVAVPYQKKFREATADLFGFIEERLAGTEDIRSSGAVDFVINGLYQSQHVVYRFWRKREMAFMLVRFLGGFLMVGGTAIAFVLGYSLFQDGILTIGAVYLVIRYVQMISRPIRELTQQAESIQNVGASIERLSDLRKLQSKILDGPGAAIQEGALSLDFDRVDFSYVESEPLLHQMSFSLAPGKVLGVLGRTGSGKTTLTRLIFRLYDPVSGTIRLGGTDIRQAKVDHLRSRVAMVTQEVQLFKATVRDNLTLFNRQIPDERILDVIRELGLSRWYESLPNGLDTELESEGRGLSAGEAQLLAFTRVFLHNPGLVIMDEASSRLDPATEQLIERAVDKLLENRTAIIVAHRLGTIERADEIMILDKGQVIEKGERESLAHQPDSHFHHLLQTGLEEVLA